MSPELTGGCLPSGPPGKSQLLILIRDAVPLDLGVLVLGSQTLHVCLTGNKAVMIILLLRNSHQKQ